jgi:hypothetical protein
MIEVQIDRLIPEEKRVLEVASLESVERSRFGVVSRAQVIDMDPEVFEGVCATLSRRHCIVLAMVRKLAVRLYWMMRKEWNYDQVIIRFAPGTARTSRWCAVEHRVIDWASAPLQRGVRNSNYDRSCGPKRRMGRIENF